MKEVPFPLSLWNVAIGKDDENYEYDENDEGDWNIKDVMKGVIKDTAFLIMLLLSPHVVAGNNVNCYKFASGKKGSKFPGKERNVANIENCSILNGLIKQDGFKQINDIRHSKRHLMHAYLSIGISKGFDKNFNDIFIPFGRDYHFILQKGSSFSDKPGNQPIRKSLKIKDPTKYKPTATFNGQTIEYTYCGTFTTLK